MSEETVDTTVGADSPESTPAAVTSETATPVTDTPDAGADSPESTPAAVTSDDEPATDQTTGQETAGGQKKLSFEERVAQVASTKVAEAEARITAKLTEVTQAKAPLDFIPDIDMDKVNSYIRDTLSAIEDAQLAGDFVKSLDLQEELRQTRESIRANETRKNAYMQEQQVTQQTQQQTEALNARIADASALVAKEYKIPEDVWKKGEEFFMAERQGKPLIDAQYREKVMLQGPVAAMLWAKDYVEQNMGKKEQDLINSKEAAKLTLPAGKTSTGAITDAAATRLADLRKAAQSGNPSDLSAYSQAKREASQ